MDTNAVGETVEGRNIGIDLRLEAIGNEVQFILDVDPEITAGVFAVLALIDMAAAKDDDARDGGRYQRRFRKSGCRPNALAQNVNNLHSIPLDPQPKVAIES
ncbi:hypothetical protein [Ensifer sp. ENS11]|uniref:hypothetical protein n=1 Tax=Ensifer sp. ENS11 TaxID=2769291 RepID=UPI0035C76812